MKVTDLINKLISLKEEHGEQDVYTIRGCGCCDSPEIIEEKEVIFIDWENPSHSGVIVGSLVKED